MSLNFNVDLPFSAMDILSQPKVTAYQKLRDMNYDSAEKVKNLEKFLCKGMTVMSIFSVLMYICIIFFIVLFALIIPPISIFFLIVFVLSVWGSIKKRKLKKNLRVFLREYARESGFPY